MNTKIEELKKEFDYEFGVDPIGDFFVYQTKPSKIKNWILEKVIKPREMKNPTRIKSVALKLFEIENTDQYYMDDDGRGVLANIDDLMDEFSMMLYEEFGIDFNELIREDGSVAEREFKTEENER